MGEAGDVELRGLGLDLAHPIDSNLMVFTSPDDVDAGVVQSVCLVERVQAFTCQFPLSTMVIFSDTLSLRRSVKEFVFLIPMKTKFGSS